MNLATSSQVTPFMVAPIIDLRDGDAKNLIYLVLPGLTTRPTPRPDQLVQKYKPKPYEAYTALISLGY